MLFSFRERLAVSGGIFDGHSWEWRVLMSSSGGSSEIVLHPTVCRTVPHDKELSSPNVSYAKDWEAPGLKELTIFFKKLCFLLCFNRCFWILGVAVVSIFLDGKFCELWITYGRGEWNSQKMWRSYLIHQRRLHSYSFVHLSSSVHTQRG